MQEKKEYKLGNESRESILKVATSIGDILGKTLGPAGRDYLIPPGLTNDGKSILEHIRFDDECEDDVALAFHEVANKTDKEVGDGTTTAVVIATELVKELLPKVSDLDAPIPGQKSVMEISRQLEQEKDRAIQLLSAKVIPVTTLEQLEQVAFTSMEDREIAKVVAQVIFTAGKDSFTAIDEGFSGKIETDIQPGIEVPVKLSYGTDVTVEDSPVLVANHLFEDYRELTPFMQSMVDFMNTAKIKFQALVIVGKQFSIPFIQRVAVVNQSSPIKIICVSNTHLADDLFEDVAAFCDAECIDTNPKGGKKITDVKFMQCGMVGKMVVTPKGAVMYRGKGTLLTSGETTRVQSRILEIRSQLEKESDAKKRTAMERRIAEFSGGKATIYVDAPTVVEKYYLKLKIIDCMNSCKAALEGGMIKGGGVSLKEVAGELQTSMEGLSLLYNALYAPYNRIQQNAGSNFEIGEDVMDSYLVAKSGIESAVSVVKTILRLEGIISDHTPSMVEELRKISG